MVFPFDIDEAENAKAVFVLAHGAGAGKDHAFMTQMSALLQERNITVIRFNFPYMLKMVVEGKRRPPDRFPILTEYYQKLMTDVIHRIDSTLPLFIGGKSMGSRVAATLLTEQQPDNLKGGICLGYPFHPQKKPENLRLLPLQNTLLPILICQGDRDLLGNEQEIANYSLSPMCHVSFLPDGDHDLKPRVKSGFNYEQHKISTANLIEEFILEKI